MGKRRCIVSFDPTPTGECRAPPCWFIPPPTRLEIQLDQFNSYADAALHLGLTKRRLRGYLERSRFGKNDEPEFVWLGGKEWLVRDRLVFRVLS